MIRENALIWCYSMFAQHLNAISDESNKHVKCLVDFALLLLQCANLDTYPLTCAPAQTGEQFPPCQDSASVPSTLGAFSLSGKLPGNSVCEHAVHQTVLRTHSQIVPICFLHHTYYHYFLYHPPKWV